jgi:hypothetical protein
MWCAGWLMELCSCWCARLPRGNPWRVRRKRCHRVCSRRIRYDHGRRRVDRWSLHSCARWRSGAPRRPADRRRCCRARPCGARRAAGCGAGRQLRSIRGCRQALRRRRAWRDSAAGCGNCRDQWKIGGRHDGVWVFVQPIVLCRKRCLRVDRRQIGYLTLFPGAIVGAIHRKKALGVEDSIREEQPQRQRRHTRDAQ